MMRVPAGLRDEAAAIILAAAFLAWPAMLNGYPLVFADTGTYLSQAAIGYLGWDRPPFYSLFLLPLHLKLTTWPIVVVHAAATALVLRVALRHAAPAAGCWTLPQIAAGLAVLSALPWHVAQIMPDLFTGLLIVVLAILILAPERPPRPSRWLLVIAAAAMTAFHLSHILLSVGLVSGLILARRWLGLGALGVGGTLRAFAPLGLAAAALIAVNAIGHGRAAISPFGNVFLLARVLYDGPGMRVLERECPRSGWRLCAYLNEFPMLSDHFLWYASSPLARVGGAKAVASEADAIVRAALLAEPLTELRAILDNGRRQAVRFRTGDGLMPWPDEVDPWIRRIFPPDEQARFAASRQSTAQRLVPEWLPPLHMAVSVGGLTVCAVLMFAARGRGNSVLAGLALAALLGAVGNALITGGLSAPHDRYQSRVMWLPLAIALIGGVGPAQATLARTAGLLLDGLRQLRSTRRTLGAPLSHASW